MKTRADQNLIHTTFLFEKFFTKKFHKKAYVQKADTEIFDKFYSLQDK